MLKPAVERHLADEPVNLVNSAKLVVAGAGYFRDVNLHRQLTVKMDADIMKGLHGTDHRGASIQCQIRISFSSIWREPNHISSVLAALSCSLRDVHQDC